jgi:predicted phage terminase large subunit-like protein
LQQQDISLEKILEFRSTIAAEDSFHEFVKQAWPNIEGSNTKFTDGMHIRAICEHLEAVFRGDINRLLINVPFRCGKSIIISICFPAWILIHYPDKRILCASYAAVLAEEHSMNCRRLIQSEWYQRRWGHIVKIQKDQNAKRRFDTTAHGYRIATSVGSSVTGFGGDLLIIDDPHNPAGAESEVQRLSTLEWYAQTFSTRLNNHLTGAEIIVMQRLHEMDLSGYILTKDELKLWTHLMLPMEYEHSRKCTTIILPSTGSQPWTDPRTEEKQLLWPDHVDEKALKIIKQKLANNYAESGQLQQLPSPSEGGLIKKHYFKHWKSKIPPKIEYVLQSWDTAISDTPTSAYSACTTWGVFYDTDGIGNAILLSVWKGRVDYPELRERAQRLFKNYKDVEKEPPHVSVKAIPIDCCLIESKATGDPLIKDLRRAGIVAQPFNPTRLGDKTARVNAITHIIEGGLIWMQAQAPNFDMLIPFADKFVDEVIRFPNAESRDLVDSMTQALFKLYESGMISHPKDEHWEQPEFKHRALY